MHSSGVQGAAGTSVVRSANVACARSVPKTLETGLPNPVLLPDLQHFGSLRLVATGWLGQRSPAQSVCSPRSAAGRVASACVASLSSTCPSVARGHDPSGEMDVEPDALGRVAGRSPGVDAHAHAHCASMRPRGGSQRLLGLGRRGHGCRRVAESDEERVALVVNLVAAMSRERIAEETSVEIERSGVVVGTEILKQPRRALDIAKKEGHDPRWLLGHERTIARSAADDQFGTTSCVTAVTWRESLPRTTPPLRRRSVDSTGEKRPSYREETPCL
jgi:hypothetical protein